MLLIALGVVGLTLPVGSPLQPARAGTTHSIQIVDFAFSPATLTVTAGDTVTWTNVDAMAHTATSTSGAFDSGSLDQGDSFSLTLTAPGTYDYLCTPHPSMTGRIVVQAAQAPTTPVAPSTGGGIPNVAMVAPKAGDLAPSLVGVGLCLMALVVGARVARRRSQDP